MAENTIEIFFNKALELERKDQFVPALKLYLEVLKKDEFHLNTHINIGSIYARMKDYNKAMHHYAFALKIKDDYISYFNMGCILYKLKKYKKAILHFEKSKKLNAKFVLSTLIMGLCYSRLNNIKAAETNFLKVIQKWPENRVALTALSIIYYNEGRFNESIKILDELIQMDSSNKKLRGFKTSILEKTDRHDEYAAELKSLKRISDGYKFFDEFISSVPVETYTDRYGTLEQKIDDLQMKSDQSLKNMLSLSLCHLFKGETDIALDYLVEIRKKNLSL